MWQCKRTNKGWSLNETFHFCVISRKEKYGQVHCIYGHILHIYCMWQLHKVILKRIIGKYTYTQYIHSIYFVLTIQRADVNFLMSFNVNTTQQVDKGIYNGLYVLDDVYPANPHQTASIISRQKGSNWRNMNILLCGRKQYMHLFCTLTFTTRRQVKGKLL